MAQYRLIKDGKIVNVIMADEEIIKQISDDYDSYELVVPEQQILPPDIETITQVSPIEFKLLFTYSERIAINEAKKTDPIIEDFYNIIEDPRLTIVRLNLQSTVDGINYLVFKNLITEQRKEQILSGVLQ